MPSPSLISGPSPARPAPGRFAARAALALSLWMAAAPAARAEGDGVEGDATAGYETRSGAESGTADGENRRAPGRRKAGKGSGDFDPKVFEARGRKLQGEYYEIATVAKAPTWSGGPTELPAEAGTVPEEPRHRNWILWGGVAGAAACVAGLTGWLLFAQPANAEPVSLHLDDKP